MMNDTDQTFEFYAALKLFDELAYSRDFLIECKLADGKALFSYK